MQEQNNSRLIVREVSTIETESNNFSVIQRIRNIGKVVLQPFMKYGTKFASMYYPTPEDKRSQAAMIVDVIEDHEVGVVIIDGSTEESLKEIQVPLVLRAGEYVKTAPIFHDQVDDPTRNQIIESVSHTRFPRGLDTNSQDRTVKLTEHESLVALYHFLFDATVKFPDQHVGYVATSMLENLTFIGRPEYDEATRGIANTWKAYLRENPNAQLYVSVDHIGGSELVKSDAFLLENILTNFSDEELIELGDKFITDPQDIRTDYDSLKVIIIDDWAISGTQLKLACMNLLRVHPELKDHLEVQVIAAPNSLICDGLKVSPGNSWSGSDSEFYIPLAAYFKAHDADSKYASYSEAHITGWHCAVDFDFNNSLVVVSHRLNRDMPPLTNIVRPYRRKGAKLVQRKRLDRLRRRSDAPIE